MDPDRIVRRPPDRIAAEAVVIGTGPGGAVATAVLAEHGVDVLAIEDGPVRPPGWAPPFSRREIEGAYRHGGLTVTLGERIVYAEGRCAGGGSEINSALYHRTPPDELDRWRTRARLIACAPEDLRPHFEAVEREVGLAPPPADLPGASARLAAGAAAFGWRSLEVPRLADPGGAAAGRRSMARTLLPRALQHGARLLPDTRAVRLRRLGDRWRVLARHAPAGAAARTIEIAAREVWLAAGAIHTPFLLLRSGFRGPVGRGLRLHTMARLVARFPEPVNDPARIAAHQVREHAPRLTFGCSVSAPPHLAMALVDHGAALEALAEDWPRLAIFYALVRAGRGRVRALPGIPDPVVSYRLGPGGMADLATGLRQLSRLLLAAGAETVWPAVPGTAPIRDAGAADRAIPPTLAGTGAPLVSLHLAGSCPMGGAGVARVADSFGNVVGAPGLRIADASAIPAAPGVNPQGTVMALARRNAMERVHGRR